jgi:phosphotransferase system  glucose/maltose/N-acetylglucosamine-specific IIC component
VLLGASGELVMGACYRLMECTVLHHVFIMFIMRITGSDIL